MISVGSTSEAKERHRKQGISCRNYIILTFFNLCFNEKNFISFLALTPNTNSPQEQNKNSYL